MPLLYAGAMFNAGQGCVVTKRLYVHDSIYDAVCDELGRLARETVIARGWAGAGARKWARSRNQHAIRASEASSSRTSSRTARSWPAAGRSIGRAISSSRPSSATCPDATPGSFARSSSARRCRCGASGSRRGDRPVPTTQTFGLGGSVWSADRDRAFGVAARINSGTVWVEQASRSPDRTRHAAARSSPASGFQSRAGRDSKSSPRRPSSTWRNSHGLKVPGLWNRSHRSPSMGGASRRSAGSRQAFFEGSPIRPPPLGAVRREY